MTTRRNWLVFLAGLALVAAVSVTGLAPAQAEKKPQTEECGMDPVTQSICVYEMILKDIRENYPLRGGGGISAIMQNSTTSFTARISREGHIDLRTYEMTFGEDGTPKIAEITEETQDM